MHALWKGTIIGIVAVLMSGGSLASNCDPTSTKPVSKKAVPGHYSFDPTCIESIDCKEDICKGMTIHLKPGHSANSCIYLVVDMKGH